jgi:hypothetical protein
VITKVPFQPAYNNVSRVTRPTAHPAHVGPAARRQAHLYPQLDEYESAPVVTGIRPDLRRALDAAQPRRRVLGGRGHGGAGRLHAVDHLLRDQQADAERQGGYAAARPDWSDGGRRSAATTVGARRCGRRDLVRTRTPATRAISRWKPHLVGISFNLFQPWA